MPLLLQAPILETERLILRPHTKDDFERLAEIYTTDRSKYIGGPLPRAKVWDQFVGGTGQWSLLGFGDWAIELKDGGAYVGQVGLIHPISYPEAEIGWTLWQEFLGKGYAFEAAQRALAFAFKELGWDTLVSYIDPRNAPSINLSAKLGGVLDEGAATPNNDPCLVYRYSTLKS